MAGGAVFAGAETAAGAGGGATSAVGSEFAVPEPLLFDAVTATRSVLPTSPAVGEYVELVAPPIELQPFPELSQRSHWYP
jgi:hypothetical protein